MSNYVCRFFILGKDIALNLLENLKENGNNMLNVVKILNREEYKEEKLKTLQVIKNLLFKNYPIDEIQEITGSDVKKINKIKASL